MSHRLESFTSSVALGIEKRVSRWVSVEQTAVARLNLDGAVVSCLPDDDDDDDGFGRAWNDPNVGYDDCVDFVTLQPRVCHRSFEQRATVTGASCFGIIVSSFRYTVARTSR